MQTDRHIMPRQPTIFHNGVIFATRTTSLITFAIVLISFLFRFSALAESGDTKIHVTYETKFTRVKPTISTGGGVVKIDAILHADGTVSDAYDVRGSRRGSGSGKLGGSSTGAIYKVVDANTIVRIGDGQTYVNTATIKVNGRKCTATIERVLKSGEKYFSSYDSSLKQTAYFSSIENENIKCRIE